MPIVKKELMNMLNNEDLKNVKLLIYANKQDLKDAAMSSDISESLNLHKIKRYIQKKKNKILLNILVMNGIYKVVAH